MKSIDSLPPVVQLFVREPPTLAQLDSLEDFHEYVMRLLPEVRRQAMWTDEHFNYPEDWKDPDLGGFIIQPSARLDPFSPTGQCPSHKCRLRSAQQIASTVGLYGDTTLVIDRFSQGVPSVQRWTNKRLYWLAGDILALLKLLPLFEAGVFQFIRDDVGYCTSCRKKFLGQMDEAIDDMLAEAGSTIKCTIEKGLLLTEGSFLNEPPMFMSRKLTKRLHVRLQQGVPPETIGRELVRSAIGSEVYEAFVDLQHATRFKAVNFSNSRVSLLTAKHLERNAPSHDEIEVWEASRSATLPWIRDLSVPQILQIREEAADALPRLRAVLASTMTDPNSDEDAMRILVKRLQLDAEEISAELNALNLPEREHDRAGFGLLGLTISIYGMAADLPLQTMAVTGLLALLGLLHTTRRNDHQEYAKLVSRPGYVLVKAKELAEHAD